MPVALDPGLDGTEAGIHPLPDHAALKFRKRARYVNEQLASKGGRVEVLLVQVEIDGQRPRGLGSCAIDL